MQYLGLQAAEHSDKVPEGKTVHTLLLAGKKYFKTMFNETFMIINWFNSGVFRGGADILAQAKLVLSDTVTMELTVKATEESVAELIVFAIE